MRPVLLMIAAAWLSGCSSVGAALERPSPLQVKEVSGVPGIDLTALVDGIPLPGSIVRVSSNGSPVREHITGVNGKVELDLVPGSWQVEVRLDGLRPASGVLVVTEDMRLDVIADLTVDMRDAIILACPLAPGGLHLPAQYTFYNRGYAWALPAP